jgi:hypothetical protein
MSTESYLENNLRKFSLFDFALVKLTYLAVSLLIFSLYSKLDLLDWWFYLVAFLICAMPLWVYLYSLPGNLTAKKQEYIKHNNPSNQILLFLSIFFFACLFSVWFPVLVSLHWWVYVILAVVFAIKPATVSRTW